MNYGNNYFTNYYYFRSTAVITVLVHVVFLEDGILSSLRVIQRL